MICKLSLWDQFQYQFKITIQPEGKGFQVLAKYWIVEQTFAGVAWYRRFSMNSESVNSKLRKHDLYYYNSIFIDPISSFFQTGSEIQ